MGGNYINQPIMTIIESLMMMEQSEGPKCLGGAVRFPKLYGMRFLKNNFRYLRMTLIKEFDSQNNGYS